MNVGLNQSTMTYIDDSNRKSRPMLTVHVTCTIYLCLVYC